MPKHSVINEYKWVILAMLGEAELPYIGSPERLSLKARTIDNGVVVIHVNIPWLLGGDDPFSTINRIEWGWTALSLLCVGQTLTKWGSDNPEATLNIADPTSNDRLREMVAEAIKAVRIRQLDYLRRR